MRRALQTFGWFCFALDAALMLALLQWAMNASDRDGESAYALVFLLISLLWLALGGGALAWSAQSGSRIGLWASTLFLAIPPGLGLALRILHAL